MCFVELWTISTVSTPRQGEAGVTLMCPKQRGLTSRSLEQQGLTSRCPERNLPSSRNLMTFRNHEN